jgi:hypothetical protein
MRRAIGLAGAAAALVTMLAAAPGALAANAVYGGSTSGGEAIVVNADKARKRLRTAVVAWKADCGDGPYFATGSALTASKTSPGFTPDPGELLMSRNGKRRFAGMQHGAVDLGDSIGAVEVRLEGRLGAKAASGTLSAKVAIIDKATGNQQQTCTTGRMRWKAARSPGRVYAGRTSQDQPFVARLDARRKRITDLLVSWDSSSCRPEGFVHYGESLSNFGLASTGRFADSWDDTEQGADGNAARITYAVAGRVARRGAARGTLRIGVTWTDAAGATTRSCDSGAVSWKATTG